VHSSDGVPHKNYNSNTVNNDIAIVRLYAPVSGPGIEPVRLPSYSMAGETFAGDTVRVSGWGRTSDCKFDMFQMFNIFIESSF
jgi:Trypsin